MSAPAIQQALQLAVEHHRAGRLAEAEPLYRQILAANPNHADAMHLLGVIAQQAGHSSDAVRLIEQAIRLNPRAPDYHANLAEALATTGEIPRAMTSFKAAL